MNQIELQKDFPILTRKINGQPLVYLDNAATSQKPRQVVNAIVDYYFKHNANVHRGIHTLSEEATEMYENARSLVADFLGTKSPNEIIFTRGATEGLNFAAVTLGDAFLKKGDVILASPIEHHSNLVPWQILARSKGAELKFIETSAEGELDLADLEKKLASAQGKVKLVAVTHASNVLGVIFDLKKISKIAHSYGALVVVDGAQAAPHMPVNVTSLSCDVYTVSAHKMLGPTGIGAMYMKKELLEKIEPYQFGGGMIETVDLFTATWAGIPERFEAGTPNIADAIGFGAAIKYLQSIGMENIKTHEETLNKYALEKLSQVKNLTIYGPKNPTKRTGLVTFTIKKLHPHDISAVLNSQGIAVRSGHHCAHPLHKKLDIPASVRASYYLYNTSQDIDALVAGLEMAQKILGT